MAVEQTREHGHASIGKPMDSFMFLRLGNTEWVYQADLVKIFFSDEGLRLPEWIADGQAQLIKSRPGRTLYRIDVPELSFYVKHFRVRGPIELVGNVLGQNKARREWSAARRLQSRSIPTCTPLALGESRRWGAVTDAFIIMQTVEDSVPFTVYLKEVLCEFDAASRSRIRRKLVIQLADLMAAVHEAGMRHRDLNGGNILVHTRNNIPICLHLIDLHSSRLGRRAGWRSSRDNLADLGRFFFPRAKTSERYRFLRHYLSLRPQLGRDTKWAARQIEPLAQQTADRFRFKQQQRRKAA